MLKSPSIHMPAGGPIRIDPGSASPWNVHRGEKSVVYRGLFTVFDPSGKPIVRVAGRVVEWPGLPAEVFLFNPPKEFRLHPHGRCLQLMRPNDRWYKMHFERPARTFDQARAYIEQVLSEAVAAHAAQPRIIEAPRNLPAPVPAAAPAIPTAPTLRYARRHHWIWIVRRSRPLVSLARVLLVGILVMRVLLLLQPDGLTFLSPLPVMLILSIPPLYRLAVTLIDWYRRTIRLYSDGRLDYTEGIFSRHCTSVSTRFGAIHFHYRNETAMLLDCADIDLPFNGGTIEAVPDFRRFWEIAQGRD